MPLENFFPARSVCTMALSSRGNRVNLTNINDLRKVYFLKTVDSEGSLRAAARRLGVTPSAVSQSISALEASMGKNLVVRGKNKVQLTNDALMVLKEIEPALNTIANVFGHDNDEIAINRLDLGIYENLAHRLLPTFMKILRKDHGQVKTNIITGRTQTLLNKLRSGELCTIVAVDSEDLENIKTQTLFTDRMGLFISKDSKYNRDLELAAQKMGVGCLSPGPTGYPRYLKKFIDSLGHSFRPTFICDSVGVLKEMALNGELISILPHEVAKTDGNNLVDILPQVNQSFPHNGEHNIVLGYLEKCSQKEALYLAEIFKMALS